MRWKDIISEGPEQDIDAHELASKMRGDVIRKFMDKTWEADRWGGSGQVMGDGRKFVRFPPGIFGWPKPFDDAVFALGELGLSYTPTGFYSRLTSGKPFVALNVVENPVDEFDAAISQVIHNHRAHDVLLHELIHMIDDAKGQNLLKPAAMAKNTKTANGTPGKSNDPDYYNSPVEFNAFFNNVADRLMAFIERSRTQTNGDQVLRDAQRNEISADFTKTVTSILARQQQVPVLAKFLKLLRKRNHRRMLSRLYKIHQEAAEIIRWAEAHTG